VLTEAGQSLTILHDPGTKQQHCLHAKALGFGIFCGSLFSLFGFMVPIYQGRHLNLQDTKSNENVFVIQIQDNFIFLKKNYASQSH
jgi:hypothetical protein